jgi:methionyl aminopeptidase
MNATKHGISTLELDKIIEDHILSSGATPTFKGYGKSGNRPGFPASSCQSINDVLVHGIPTSQLKMFKGDIISIDVGVTKGGCIADSCFSYGLGDVSPEAKALLKAAHDITMYGVSICKAGLRIHDLARLIAEYAESLGPYSTMCDLYGHGTGVDLHEDPRIPYTRSNLFKEFIPNHRLEKDMVITIEPVVVPSSCNQKYSEDLDRWTLRAVDKSWSAQFEHTILITDSQQGPEILTGDFPSDLLI